MDTKVLIIVLFVSTIIVTTSLAKTLLAQVLERDVDAPTNLINGTTVPGGISIDIDPTETLPTNGTVTMSFNGATDTNMNVIPPPGVTVIITADSVTVTNQEVSTGSAGSDSADNGEG
ncbi:MAG TPA: hypothetical protein VE544_09900 [Nitrososphaeraceae archaeon]|nr:hypothetical protein [Nitrososphaeraceae archaeon]